MTSILLRVHTGLLALKQWVWLKTLNKQLCVCVYILQGEIQQLLIDPDPRAAADYCQNYIPDCDSALPYTSLLLDPEEVAPPTII